MQDFLILLVVLLFRIESIFKKVLQTPVRSAISDLPLCSDIGTTIYTIDTTRALENS